MTCSVYLYWHAGMISEVAKLTTARTREGARLVDVRRAPIAIEPCIAENFRDGPEAEVAGPFAILPYRP